MNNNIGNFNNKEEVFSTKIISSQPKNTLREKMVLMDNEMWAKGQRVNFFGIEGMKLLPSDEWISGNSDFCTVNLFKNIGHTISDSLKGIFNDDSSSEYDEQDDVGYVVEPTPIDMIENDDFVEESSYESIQFNSGFDKAPEKYEPAFLSKN